MNKDECYPMIWSHAVLHHSIFHLFWCIWGKSETWPDTRDAEEEAEVEAGWSGSLSMDAEAEAEAQF